MGLPAPAPGTHWLFRCYLEKTGLIANPVGWSETYHLQATSYTEALSMADAVWQARRATLAQDVLLVYGYVSDEAIKGDSLLYTPAPGTFAGSYGDIHVFTIAPWNVCLVRIEAGALYHTLRPIRGIPSNEDLTTFVPSPAYAAALATFGDVLKAKTFFRVKVKPNDTSGIGQWRIISTVAALKFRERKAGRPFGLLHGRSRQRAAF